MKTSLETRREIFTRFNRDARNMAMDSARRMRQCGEALDRIRDAVKLARIANQRLIWWMGQRV